MLPPFKLHNPGGLASAQRLLAELDGEAGVYAGGTELLLAMKQGFLSYEHLINIKKLPLDYIAYDEEAGQLRIGVTTTHRSVEQSDVVRTHFPLLASVESQVANVRVRAVGTVGGNLCFAEPRSDLGAALLLYGASVNIFGAGGERTVPIDEFFVDAYTTCLEPGDILCEVTVPRLPAPSGAAYCKFAFQERPLVGVGVVLVGDGNRERVEQARVVIGSVGPRPVRVAAAEEAFAGVSLTDGDRFAEAAAEAARRAREASDAMDDFHGSADYKETLVEVLVRRCADGARAELLEGVRSDG